MPKIRRHAVTLAVCLPFLLLVDATTASAPSNSEVGNLLTPSRVASPSADSIINLKQWRSESGGNDHWYGILAVLHDWIEADSIARTLALDTMLGYLATIQGASENYFIFDSVLPGVDPPSIEKQFLLGGQKRSGVWQWASDESLCYLNWASGEPTVSHFETVISMWGPTRLPQPTPPGSWNNTSADDGINPSVRFWAVVEWGDLNMAPVSTCGNGVAECGEDCDDGNLIDNDGCNSICESEVCGDGIVQPWEECDDGNLIAGDGCDPVCSLQVCGNGVLEPGEECDDGNLVPDDGCNSMCDLEECGDGVRQPWEECDDGNQTAGDGCDPVCQIECGNGRLDFGECCDDSNVVAGDGCSPLCIAESTVCGNGIVECPENCDDGNLQNLDGCENSCTITCVPGDVNESYTATASDLINLINYVFIRGGVLEPCWSAGDMNCNSVITSADIITLVNYLFKSGSLGGCDRCAPCT